MPIDVRSLWFRSTRSVPAILFFPNTSEYAPSAGLAASHSETCSTDHLATTAGSTVGPATPLAAALMKGRSFWYDHSEKKGANGLITKLCVYRTSPRHHSARRASSWPESPRRRLRLKRTYQLVSCSTNPNSFGMTVYRRYAFISVWKCLSTSWAKARSQRSVTFSDGHLAVVSNKNGVPSFAPKSSALWVKKRRALSHGRKRSFRFCLMPFSLKLSSLP
mmetsp:Transcript_6192/g.15931  ORF Transcript_6192/g.15931 Transcript_6192/m.15931 type:complete len:220 (-) Transcript_6192:2182-2841(-)